MAQAVLDLPRFSILRRWLWAILLMREWTYGQALARVVRLACNLLSS